MESARNLAARLTAELLTPTPEKLQRLQELRKAAAIPAELNLDISALPMLTALVEQISQCPACGGRINAPCEKITVTAAGLDKIPCPLQAQRRAAEKAQRLMTTARIPKRFRDIRAGKDFEVTTGNRAAVAAAESAIDADAGMYVYGAAGVGKTMLVCVIANERARLGKSSLFITVPDMLEELRDFDAAERRAAKLQLLYSTPCLIIDDLGAERATPWAADTLFRVFNHRYNEELQTIVTSNFALTDIAARLPDYTGERVARRIRACCREIFMAR